MFLYTNLQYIGEDYLINYKKTYISRFFYSCKLKEIPEGLFKNCTKVESFIECFRGCNITEIPEGLFKNCTKVTTFKGCFFSCMYLKEVPAALFDNCTKVTSFEECFRGCYNLELAFFPIAKLNNAYYYNTYYQCSKIKIWIVNSETPITPINSLSKNSDMKIYVPDSAIETYKMDSFWSSYADYIVGFSELSDEEKQKYGIA